VPQQRRPWILYLGLPALALFTALWVYDQRPVLAKDAVAPGVATLSSDRAPFALVELFTSEGCSSCPPAEALLGEVALQARSQGTRVFALAWHVDYWNHLGWKDPYASPAHTLRQRRYAKALRTSDIYTPQMIVNGKQHFVGSSRSGARAAIRVALSTPPALGLSLSRRSGLGVAYRIQGDLPLGAQVVACLTERGLTTAIEEGENAGRALPHEEVVRAFRSQVATAEGEVQLSAPSGLRLERSSLVVFVQAKRHGAILGAARLDLEGR
jgi:hypothetical protein